MTLYDFIGPWLYWSLVTVAVSGAATWTINSITILYTELHAQIKELRRVV